MACKPCAAARKVFPKPVRRRLEDLERALEERRARQEQRRKARR